MRDEIVEPIGMPEYFADGFGNYRTVNGIFRFVAFTEILSPGDRATKMGFVRFNVPAASAMDSTERARAYFSQGPTPGLMIMAKGYAN